MADIASIQKALAERQLDGWLFYDHHHRDPIAYHVLGLPEGTMATRRWFYLLPAEGEPMKLVHRIESARLDSLPGRKRSYSSWQELSEGVKELLAGRKRVAMQYSPNNLIPYIGLVDAGTVEMVRGKGVEVVSSADLVQIFEARWSPEAYQSHISAGKKIDQIVQMAFAEIGRRRATDEYSIQRFMLEKFDAAGLVTEDPPIVAVNRNSGDPHYEPREDRSARIVEGDWVLLDVWGKEKKPGAVYYDITWVGYFGPEPPQKIRDIFTVVRDARDVGVQTVSGAVREGRSIQGWQVDDAVRGHIRSKGYGDYFVHRTGHSIGEHVHGNGANMDNLETHDERQIIPGTCFSIEPGIYLPEFGVRCELNMFIEEGKAGPTGAIQRDIVRIGAAAG